MELQKLQKKMKSKLTKDRYLHTQGVMYTSASLAMKHGANISDAMLAGLLHDCAKCYSDEEKMRLCKKYHVILTQSELQNPSLIHAKLGAAMAERKYEVTNANILDAISFHTTGREEMSLLEKIVYIADFIEPNRTEIPGLSEIRKASFEDIDYAVYLTAKSTLEYLMNRRVTIDSGTERTYQYYQQLLDKKNPQSKRVEDVNDTSENRKISKRRNILWNKQKKWRR